MKYELKNIDKFIAQSVVSLNERPQKREFDFRIGRHWMGVIKLFGAVTQFVAVEDFHYSSCELRMIADLMDKKERDSEEGNES